MFKTLSFSLRCAACLLGATSVFANTDNPAPKQIILMIGDGMGPAMTTAFRHYADDPKTPGLRHCARSIVGWQSQNPSADRAQCRH